MQNTETTNTQDESFTAFWERMGNKTPQELYEMCQESTKALSKLREYYMDVIDKLIIAHDLDILEDPDTEHVARKVLEKLCDLYRQGWNLDYNEQEQEEQEYFLSNPYVVLAREERP